jgi:signal transduction histidine kinase
VAIDILTDLLTYDKIESGVQELDLSEVDIEANVRSVLDQFKVQSRQNGVKLYYCNNFVCDEGKGPIVQGDTMKITQVIRNLVSNAVKFSRANDVVNIELLVEPPDGDKGAVIRLEVKDSGPGISKEDQLRLFREVVQFRPNELQKGAGSGLGTLPSVPWLQGSISIFN